MNVIKFNLQKRFTYLFYTSKLYYFTINHITFAPRALWLP